MSNVSGGAHALEKESSKLALVKLYFHRELREVATSDFYLYLKYQKRFL